MGKAARLRRERAAGRRGNRVPLPELRSTPGQPPPVRNNDLCPVCGVAADEEGALWCCDASVVSCEGTLDGVPVSQLEDDEDLTDEEFNRLWDRRWDQIVRHTWYADTGEPAPGDHPGGPTRCRCEQSA